MQEELEQLRNSNRDLRRAFDRVAAIQRLASEVSACHTLDQIVLSILEVVPRILPCRACRVLFLENEVFRPAGEKIVEEGAATPAIDQEVVYWCCRRGAVMAMPGQKDRTGQAIVPLAQAAEIIGAVLIDLGEHFESYSEETERALMTMASHAALAIQNTRSRALLEDKAQRLVDMKEYIDQVIASIAHAIITLDPGGRITVFNRKAEDFFEIRSVLAVGNHYSSVLPEHLQGVFSELLINIQQGRIPEAREISIRTVYHEERPAQITVSPLNMTGSHRPGMVCICRDLTLSKELERLRELDQLKDDFISMVSHELKTPLASILAYARTLLDGLARTDEERREYLQVIHDEGRRLEQMVNNILDLSRIESGKMTYNMEVFSPADLLRKGASLGRGLCAGKKQELAVPPADGLPPVWGDFEKLTQVVVNLLSNAVKFTPEGGRVELGAQLRPGSGERPSEMEFYVSDNGIGIRREDFPKVFEKFTQVEDVMNHSQGSGLGMHISRRIMLQHDADLVLESEPGRGSRFYFRLRVVDPS